MSNQIQLSNLTQQQLDLLAAFAAQNGLSLETKVQKTKEVDHLNYNENNMAICLAHENHVFNVNEISDIELQKRCKRSGLCLDCIKILDEAEIIRKKMARTRQFVDNQPSVEKPGYQIRELIKQYADTLKNNRNILKQFQDAAFCKAQFKLQYALLLNITGKTAEEVGSLRKDAKGYVRYSPQNYQIGKQVFLLTNDLYMKNLAPIKEFFTSLK